VVHKIKFNKFKKTKRRLTHGIRFAPSGLGLHKPPVGRALSAGTPFVAVCSATFCKPCKHSVFAYSGLQNVFYLRALGEIQNANIRKLKKWIFCIFFVDVEGKIYDN
jgi:hypothetical protein